MNPPDVSAWLVAGYALLLLAAAWGFDLLARRTSNRAADWQTGGFTYHADHDAWQCPKDEWLWPTSFDPDSRVMRYRGKPSVCNSCPVKADCTSSPHGREISRHVDPWPHSEAGRFHRGIACVIAALAFVMLLLVGVSIASWAAIFRKLFALKRVKALNEAFERDFAARLLQVGYAIGERGHKRRCTVDGGGQQARDLA